MFERSKLVILGTIIEGEKLLLSSCDKEII